MPQLAENDLARLPCPALGPGPGALCAALRSAPFQFRRRAVETCRSEIWHFPLAPLPAIPQNKSPTSRSNKSTASNQSSTLHIIRVLGRKPGIGCRSGSDAGPQTRPEANCGPPDADGVPVSGISTRRQCHALSMTVCTYSEPIDWVTSFSGLKAMVPCSIWHASAVSPYLPSRIES